MKPKRHALMPMNRRDVTTGQFRFKAVLGLVWLTRDVQIHPGRHLVGVLIGGRTSDEPDSVNDYTRTCQ